MNKLYPGLPDYTGPIKGMFTLLHHEGPLLEWSHDVMVRVAYIKREKTPKEIPTRLRHIVHYPDHLIPAEWQKANAEWQKAYAEWQKANAEWEKADWFKILPYLHQHVEDCRWNGKELVFD